MNGIGDEKEKRENNLLWTMSQLVMQTRGKKDPARMILKHMLFDLQKYISGCGGESK